jgi:hypothetical protein
VLASVPGDAKGLVHKVAEGLNKVTRGGGGEWVAIKIP